MVDVDFDIRFILPFMHTFHFTSFDYVFSCLYLNVCCRHQALYNSSCSIFALFFPNQMVEQSNSFCCNWIWLCANFATGHFKLQFIHFNLNSMCHADRLCKFMLTFFLLLSFGMVRMAFHALLDSRTTFRRNNNICIFFFTHWLNIEH